MKAAFVVLAKGGLVMIPLGLFRLTVGRVGRAGISGASTGSELES
jgi:hypothetical protein